ncbi:sensor histidine kinase [Neokomagataea anthophila]|uniref:histidine kinase n=1 Tax=Neokomagataea anthophila TaxID=2826925 RepID=A0ABS5EAE5_9PROT|nr:HAMP domain-containing sensor histidine kinase [Neokomagataea anthophila]MBR0560453.1 HAMP domain-containing histidine kinase [Neokomagataea anthophila]
MKFLLFRTAKRRLSPIVCTSSFEIAALFAALFILLGGIILSIVEWQGERLLTEQLHAISANEMAELLDSSISHDTAHLAPLVASMQKTNPSFLYFLENAKNEHLAGTITHLKPVPGKRVLSWPHTAARPKNHHAPLAGIGTILDDGGYLYVGVDASAVNRLRHGFFQIGEAGALAFVVIGISAGFLLGYRVQARIDAITVVTSQIMEGDFTCRVPLRGTGDELDRLARDINRMVAKIETLFANLQQVSNDIAHDMRRPLARLRHRLIALRNTEQNHEKNFDRTAELDVLLADLDDALSIFSSLLRISELQADTTRSGDRRVFLPDAIRKIASLYGAYIETRQQTLIIEALDPAFIEGDPILLQQMLSNIIENATLHTPIGTKIRLSVQSTKTHHEINITDNGPGIPENERTRVLERFVRLEASRTTPGNGLGLSLAQAIATRHGAILFLTDNNPGTRVCIHFPSTTLQPIEKSV